MAKQEIDIPQGTPIELTSLRTRRKYACHVDSQLGEGGMGKVYAGTLEDGSQIVLKSQRFHGREAEEGLELEIASTFWKKRKRARMCMWRPMMVARATTAL